MNALDQLARLWEEKLESPTEARKILERILESDPASITALTGLARIFENLEDWEHCQQYLEKAALLEPQGSDGAELAFRRGKVAEKLGDAEKALSCWEEAMRLYPAHQETFEVLSERARAANDKEAILRLMQKRLPLVLDNKPRLTLLRQMADLYIELGASEAAYPALEEALSLDPSNMEIKQRLGDAYFTAANYPKAGALYQKLLDDLVSAKAPRKDLAPLYQRLGGIKESEGDLEGALELYTLSQKADTTYVANLISMARLYARQENHEQAQRMFRALLFQRIEGEITKAQIFLEIARIEIKTGNGAKAKSSLQRGLAEDPNHPELKALLETL
jgi:tetratricopeptide (TPR) repeat protein